MQDLTLSGQFQYTVAKFAFEEFHSNLWSHWLSQGLRTDERVKLPCWIDMKAWENASNPLGEWFTSFSKYNLFPNEWCHVIATKVLSNPYDYRFPCDHCNNGDRSQVILNLTQACLFLPFWLNCKLEIQTTTWPNFSAQNPKRYRCGSFEAEHPKGY